MGQKFYCYIFEKFVYSLCLNGGVEITLFLWKRLLPTACSVQPISFFFISANTNKAGSQFSSQYIGQYRYRNYIARTLAHGKVVWEVLEKFWMKLTIKFYDISKNLFMNDLIAALNSMHFFLLFYRYIIYDLSYPDLFYFECLIYYLQFH